MKAWNRLTVLVPALLLLLLVGLNGLLLQLRDETIPDEALVEINRMAKELEKGKQMNELASSKIQVELLELKKTSMQSYMDRSRTRSVLLPASRRAVSIALPIAYSAYRPQSSGLSIPPCLVSYCLLSIFYSISAGRSYSPSIIWRLWQQL